MSADRLPVGAPRSGVASIARCGSGVDRMRSSRPVIWRHVRRVRLCCVGACARAGGVASRAQWRWRWSIFSACAGVAVSVTRLMAAALGPLTIAPLVAQLPLGGALCRPCSGSPRPFWLRYRLVRAEDPMLGVARRHGQAPRLPAAAARQRPQRSSGSRAACGRRLCDRAATLEAGGTGPVRCAAPLQPTAGKAVHSHLIEPRRCWNYDDVLDESEEPSR